MTRGLFDGGIKTVATVASTGAALVSILTFLHSWGMFGSPAVRGTVGNMGARWIGVKPVADTARAVNDTLHLAATITDKNGSILYGARPSSTTENPAVATVEQDGSVIAHGAGATTVIAVVGELSARSRIVVHQRVATVRIAGDSAIAMAEGDTRTLEARAFDARGWVIPNRAARWKVAEGDAVTVDSAATVRASDVGRAILNVDVDGVSAQTLVTVAPSPAAISIVKGDAQRATAGGALADRVIVRVVNRRGRPVEGTLVRFRIAPDAGLVDPAAVVTDADGRARTAWTLGDRPGRQRLLATVERVDSALVIFAEAEPSAANTRVSALLDTLTGVVGQPADGSVHLRLTDSTGRALSDVPVTWTVQDGGIVRALAERTDSIGEVRAQWTLGRKAGAQRLTARVAGGIAPLVLTAAARPAAPATIALERVKRKGDAPRTIGVVAVVRDTFGNIVPRASVRLLPRAGSVEAATVESDSTGRASVVWTLAAKSGDQSLIASVGSGAASDTLVARGPSASAAGSVRQSGRASRPSPPASAPRVRPAARSSRGT